MRIKIHELEMAHDSTGPGAIEQECAKVAKQFGVIVEIADRAPTGGGGWPTINMIGTPHAIHKALTSGEGGWASGDDEQDAEVAYLYMKAATEVFG